MIKTILLTFLLLSSLQAGDPRISHYSGAVEWEKDANTNADSAFNLGVIYHKTIEDYDKAAYYYKKAYKLDKGSDAANNLGYLYDDLKKYKKAIYWYKLGIDAGDGDSAMGLALLYKNRLKDNKNAIKYYKKAISMGHNGSAYNLAILYEDVYKDYTNAIKYYEKAYEMGYLMGGFNLAILYRDTLKQPDKAIKWYKKGAKKGHISSTKGAAYFYYNNGDKIKGGAYFIALINVKYPKAKVINFLKTKWKLTDKELQEAYKLQLKLDIPKHYRGGID